jgi:hypothetical protein
VRGDIGGDPAAVAPVRPDRALALVVARAHPWRALLQSGRYADIGGPARDVGVDNSYLARMLRLTLLAPGIIESVLDGAEPDGLSLEKLYQATAMCDDQRETLGQEEPGA